MKKLKVKSSKGAALLYFAVILLLGSIVALNFSKYYLPNRNSQDIQNTTDKIKQIENALIKFVENNDRMPCPAANGLTVNDPNFGVEARDPINFTCNIKTTINNNGIFMGEVPAIALGLDKEQIIDSWGGAIEYVVPQNLTMSKANNGSNNFDTNVGSLIIKTEANQVIISDASYLIISRGMGQRGAWVANSGQRMPYPDIGDISRDNLECQVSGPCSNAMFDNQFRISSGKIDNIIYYGDKNKLDNECQYDTASIECNTINCQNNVWFNNVNTINAANALTYNFPANTIFNTIGGKVSFNLQSLNATNGNIYLNYQYQQSGSSTILSEQIALFSNKANFTGQYDASYVGKTITIPFGSLNDIPLKLFFSVDSNAIGASMQITNGIVSFSPAEAVNALNYEIWQNVVCTSCTGYKCNAADKFNNKYSKDLGCENSNGYGQGLGNDRHHDDDHNHYRNNRDDNWHNNDGDNHYNNDRHHDNNQWNTSYNHNGYRNSGDYHKAGYGGWSNNNHWGDNQGYRENGRDRGDDNDRNNQDHRWQNNGCYNNNGENDDHHRDGGRDDDRQNNNCNQSNTTSTCTMGDFLLYTANYPNPTYKTQISSAQGYSGYGVNYGSLIYGYFTPDQTAQYTFYIAANKEATLGFSTDSNPANVAQVASRTTPSSPFAWSAPGGATYGPVTLNAGKSYYFELLHISPSSSENFGFVDNLALGCSRNNGVSSATSISVLGISTQTSGCAGVISTAPLLSTLQQPKCSNTIPQ